MLLRAAIEKTLAELGCKTSHIESEDTGGFEADDAACPDGRFDIYFDTAFKVVRRAGQGLSRVSASL